MGIKITRTALDSEQLVYVQNSINMVDLSRNSKRPEPRNKKRSGQDDKHIKRQAEFNEI